MASSQKCLAKGSSPPGPVPKGRIRLYSMRFCPFAHRARLVLHAKGIKHDTININLKDKPDWFFEKNPFGLVPVLETPGGQVVYESPITCDYLDEVYAEKKLLPADPFEKAQQKMLLEHFSKVIPYFYKIPTVRQSGEDTSKLEEEMKEKLKSLNETLARKKTKFFGGDSITMIDYMIWPWFERIEMYGLEHCMDGKAELKKWTEFMLEDPSVKANVFSSETHKGFYRTYAEGKPDYDYGL
ncbi:glutathione S-transferase omega-1-like [Megalops cyprinoides]|uniref:glutathione S-transferase omega-1-like n=1 Tax=Megalops cyprinoides TaxID=118141 RepID=UPI0018656632|nr:glutathione S-transferase omega-1-like [Megalops cyprinoides]XP_036402401.1 glutathione S-transferase omega-1-like [Megalops cyprinoides]